MTKGIAMNIRHAVVDSALGELTLVGDGEALIGVYFQEHWPRPPKDAFGARVDARSDVLLETTHTQLADYLAGKRIEFELPTRSTGHEAQLRVWKLLTDIPFGETVTYGELATALADGTTAWDVGQAVGRNPLSIVIPCHRVIGRDGKITGYAGGVERKQFLLELEESADVKAARLF
jgi:methylated-DNA-[protein]-cysteine S-methyltransferase